MSEGSDRGVTATIKYGKDYDEPWIVFRGTPDEVKADIVAAYGWEAEQYADVTLSQVVLNAAAEATAMRVLSVKLDAVPVNGTGKTTAPNDEAQTDPWAGLGEGDTTQAPAEPVDPNAEMLARIDEVSSVEKLKDLWANNRELFDTNAELLAAWKAKGKSLQ